MSGGEKTASIEATFYEDATIDCSAKGTEFGLSAIFCGIGENSSVLKDAINEILWLGYVDLG